MNSYLALKWLHIVSSVLLVGTGFGSAFYFYFANRSGSVPAQAVVARLVVRADGWFTAPAAIVQPVSGIALAVIAGWPLWTPWLASALVLYVMAGACWLPVVAIQIRMAGMAQRAADTDTPLPPEYAQLARRWERLGYPAFVAMLVVYALMVFKPAAWPWD
jgi:uncharacterized membrane protein